MSLSEALKQQITQLSELKQLLDNELQLITARDAEALLKLVENKQSTLNKIQEQDVVIASLYDAKMAYPEDVQNMLADAKELLEACKYGTQVNAKAVEQGQLRLEHLRKLLIETRNKESMTYDKSGRAQGGSSLGSIKA